MKLKSAIIVGQAYPTAPDSLVGPVRALAERTGREVTFQHKQMWAGENYIFQFFADYNVYQAGFDWAVGKLLDHATASATSVIGGVAIKWIKSLRRSQTVAVDPLTDRSLEELFDGLKDALGPDKPYHEQMCDLSLGIPTNATGERDAGAFSIRQPEDFLVGWISLGLVAKWMQLCVADFLDEFGDHPGVGTARTSVSIRESGDTVGVVEVEVEALRRSYTITRSANADKVAILVEDFGTPPS